MIIWLASYPKSGNTWVRLFLNSLLFSKDKSIDINNITIKQFPLRKNFEGITCDIDTVSGFVKNCEHTQTRINLDNKIKFFKTHNAFWKSGEYSFTNKENTLGVIYIVRDPRNIITSIKNHYSLNNYDEALEFLKDEKTIIGLKNSTAEMDLPTIVSSWKNHFNSWKKLNCNYLLIKYENLLDQPLTEFFKITNFLKKISNFNFNEKNIYKSIENSNFINLKEKEKLYGFNEASKNKLNKKINFFNLGPDNDYKKLLDNKIKNEIENSFKIEMKELNYL